MEKVVIIDGQEVRMRASALIPRIYRAKFGRDLIADMRALERKYTAAVSKAKTDEEAQEAQFSYLDMECFENLAYCMAANAGKVPADPEAWLDQFEAFSIYEVLPEIMELWSATNNTTSEPRKKVD